MVATLGGLGDLYAHVFDGILVATILVTLATIVVFVIAVVLDYREGIRRDVYHTLGLILPTVFIWL